MAAAWVSDGIQASAGDYVVAQFGLSPLVEVFSKRVPAQYKEFAAYIVYNITMTREKQLQLQVVEESDPTLGRLASYLARASPQEWECRAIVYTVVTVELTVWRMQAPAG